MKQGWTYMRLGDIASIKSGKSISAKDILTDSLFPCYGGNGIRGYVENYNYDGECPIIGRVGALCGNVHLAKGKFYATEHALVVELNNQNVDPKWLSYQLIALNLRNIAKGAAQPVIAASEVAKRSIHIPPLTEQERIVERLDAAFAQIDELKSNAEKQLAEARALFQSALTQVMQPKPGWQEKTLKEITTKIGSGATPRGGKSVYIETGVALIRSMNVHNGYFKYDNLAHISDEAATLLNGVELKQNDVLFNITGASIARCCVVPDDVLPARVNQHVAIIRPIAVIVDPRFLSYVLISKTHQNELLSIGLSGATRQALTKKDLENHIVSLPTNHKQKEILDILDNFSLKVRELEEISRKTAAECDVLKQALLRQIFE